MLKRLGMMFILLASFIVPTSSAFADTAETTAETAQSGGNLIYFLVIGFLVVICVGMYAFTEGTRKD